MKHRKWWLFSLLCSSCLSLDPLVYAPSKAPYNANLLAKAANVPKDLRHEIRNIVTTDGIRVNTWTLTHRADDNTPTSRHGMTILYCHGNALNISAYALRVQALWKLGYTVVIFDYRGFGKTPGKPTEPGIYNDARAVYDYIVSPTGMQSPQAQIGLYGYSLGTAVCTQLAIEQQSPALLLEAPFASLIEMEQDDSDMLMPHLWFLNATMDTRGKIPQYNQALMAIHGTHDTFIQPRYSYEIIDAAKHSAKSTTLWIVKDADHLTVPCIQTVRSNLHGDCVDGFSPEYLSRVDDFFSSAL